MKAIRVIMIGVLLSVSAMAFTQVSVNINIGSAPMWGPVGYTEVRYYYLPAVEAYYDIQSFMFIYYSGGVWVHRTSLPVRYRNYDLYQGYKVVMTDYLGDTPYTNFKSYKKQYSKNYRGPSQKTIGDHQGRENSKSKAKGSKGYKKNH